MSESIQKAVGVGRAASGKQPWKHMFRQQWLHKEQAAYYICLGFMLQLIQEQGVHMCVCAEWKCPSVSSFFVPVDVRTDRNRSYGCSRIDVLVRAFEWLMENAKEFLPFFFF